MGLEIDTTGLEMREAFGRMLVELGREDSRIVVLDADLNTSTRTVLFAEAFPKRFFQFGIAEQNMFGVAAGLATQGFIPFPTTFAVFATERACDQVRVSIAYPKLNVKIPGCYPGIPTGKAGATHQSLQDLSNMRSMPNMRVVDPGDNNELKQVMLAAVRYDGPVYFRVQRPEVPDILGDGYRFEWGKAALLQNGGDATVIGTGIMTASCLEAANELRRQGLEVRVLHMPCIKPIDAEAIVAAARETKAIVTVENHSINGGLGSAVAEVLAEDAPCYLKRLGFQDTFLESAPDEDLYVKYGLGVEHIVEGVKALVSKPG